MNWKIILCNWQIVKLKKWYQWRAWTCQPQRSASQWLIGPPWAQGRCDIPGGSCWSERFCLWCPLVQDLGKTNQTNKQNLSSIQSLILHYWFMHASLTSTRYVELDAEVSIGAARVVTGCQDDPPDGFDLSDHTGNSRCWHNPILTNDQPANLRNQGWDKWW